MVLNEVPEIFDGNYMTKFDYRVPRRESVRYNYYSYSLAVAIVFCSLWLLCRLKKRWFTNAKCSLCKRIAEMWKRYKKVENLAQAVDGKKPTVRSIKAEIDRPKNSDSSNEQLNTTSFFDISNFDQMTERSLMIEKVYLRKHLLTSETKLNASMRETMEIRKMLLLVMGNEMPIGESPPRRLKIDASAQYSNVKGRDGNGSSTRSCLEDDARSSELVTFISKIINQKDEMIEKLLKHTEEILELNEKLRRENERITVEAGFKATRSSSISALL